MAERRAKLWFQIRKRNPRPCKRKGGVAGLQTDYEIFAVIHTGGLVARVMRDFLNQQKIEMPPKRELRPVSEQREGSK